MSNLLVALALSAADPLAPWPPAAPPTADRLVRRGEPVSLRMRSGALTIATPGRALGDGRLGARIRVVVLSTRRTLEGIVEGAGEIRLVTP